jgi:transcriptional regulator with XRE-family HTH domain/quercetin dioxygenase-like cupin family protein
VSQEPAEGKRGSVDGPAQPSGPGAPLLGVGQQLRRARLAVGVSVREMARRVGVSPSFISQVELGRTMPSVGTLYAIASELGVSLDGLMPLGESPAGEPGVAEAAGEPAREEPVAVLRAAGQADADPDPPEGAMPHPAWAARLFTTITDADSPVQRAGSRHELRIGGAVWGRLTSDHDPANDFLHVLYKPGGESCPADQLIHHRGREYGYIITGRLNVQVGFDHYELNAGDSINFESMTPHRLSNPYDANSYSIWIVVGRGGTPVL